MQGFRPGVARRFAFAPQWFEKPVQAGLEIADDAFAQFTIAFSEDGPDQRRMIGFPGRGFSGVHELSSEAHLRSEDVV